MTSIKIQEIAIFFKAHFDRYCTARENYSEWTGTAIDLFPRLTKILSKPGTIEVGKVGDDKYIMITTKVGNVMLYQADNVSEVKYFCDASYSICQSARIAGFGTTAGVVETLEQLKHIFNIAASYKV